MDAVTAGRAVRALAVLALAVAVLAMHGLVGGHHGTVAVAAAGVGEAVSWSAEGGTEGSGQTAASTAPDGLHLDAPGLPTAAAAAGAAQAAEPHGCDDQCSDRFSGLLLLCVATLLGVGLALAGGTARTNSRTAPVRSGTAGRLHRRASVRRLDPVSELCISRT